jgi:CSLREA domain-containing protein
MNATPRKPTWTRILAVTLLLALALSLQPVPAARAATFTVTKLVDTNDGACNADCSLREAVIAANNNAGAVTDYSFSSNGTISPLVPEGALAALNGENPNGTWILSIRDDTAADNGSLNSWELSMDLISCTYYLPAIMKNN